MANSLAQMAFTVLCKQFQLKPRVRLTVTTVTLFDAVKVSQFCSSTECPIHGSAENQNSPEIIYRSRQSKRRDSEKLGSIICRMMASRAWTTRMQKSIRSLVPEFDESLVYNVLNGARKSDHALQFFRWVERAGLFKHTRETHLKIFEILGGDSKLNHARCILLDMPKKGVAWDEDMFVILIDSYGKAGIVQESVKVFQKMKELGVERTVKSYNTLFKVISRRGRYMMAKRFFNKMVNEGIMPTRHTYNLLIWGFFLSLRMATAMRFFEDMKSRGISANVVTYNTMINGCNRLKKIEVAEKFFLEMKEQNIAPTVITYTTMIKSYGTVGKLSDCLRMLEEMKSIGIQPNAITYSTLLLILCDADKPADAECILKEMVDGHISPIDNSIFMKLLACQFRAADFNAAADVLSTMNWLGVVKEARLYPFLLENFCKAGEYDHAVKILEELINREIIASGQSNLEMPANVYNPLIGYLCTTGQTAKAETFFRQLMKTGVEDQEALNNLIRGHSKEGSPEPGFEILKIMQRRSVPRYENSYQMLIESYLRKGEPADAKTALDSMVGDGFLPDSALFRSVMESLLADERVQTASRVMRTMLEKGVKKNMDLVEKTLEALFTRGHVEEALGRVHLLTQEGCVVDLDRLLHVLSDKGKTLAALKLLDFGLEWNLNIDFKSYHKVLDSLLGAGKTLNAYSLLCKIMDRGPAPDWSSCEDLIRSLEQEGFSNQADVLSKLIHRD